jgi:hypothetical protein
MAEAVQTSGFTIPPIPPTAQQAGSQPAPAAQPFQTPPAPAPQPAPQGGFTQADIDRAVAAALAGKQATPAAQVPANVPAPTPLGNPAASLDIADAAASDTLLTSLTNTFATLGNGVDINRAIGNALTLNNPALIDKAYLQEKGGTNASALVALAESIVGRVQDQTKAAESAVYKAAGDKATWDAAAAAFNQRAPAHLKAVVAKLLESGNPDAIGSGAQYVLEYSRQQGLVPQQAGLVQAGAGVAGAQALSKEQFQEALFKLDKNARGFEQARAELFARRQVGKQQGI